MAECIVDTFGIVQDFADLHGDMSTPLYQAIMDVMVSRQREEIVRCSDCKWCMAYSKIVYCELFAHRMPNNELDGFCAWGEKGEDA